MPLSEESPVSLLASTGLRHRVGEQPVRFIRTFVGGKIVGALEIDRVDFLYRDKLRHINAAVRLGFERFQLGFFEFYVLTLSDLVASHPFRRARSRPCRPGKTIDCARASRTFCAADESECCGLLWPNRVRRGWRPDRRRGRRERWAEPLLKRITTPEGRSMGKN